MTDCRGIKLLAGNSNLELAQKISQNLRIKLGKTTVSKFSNGESNVEIVESVRNMDVYIIQSISNPNPNDHIMELLILIDAAKRASPYRITAVIPYLGYSRRDKKDKGRAPITSKLLSAMVQRAGANRIISVDLHTTITRGFWDIPVENLSVDILFLRYINRNIFQHLDDQLYHSQYFLNGNMNAFSFRDVDDKAEKVVVSPDENGADRAKYLADILGVDIAVIYQKKGHGNIKEPAIVGNVEGKVAILIDDMADTCTKLKRAADLLHDKGAVDIFMLCTHGLFSGDAIKKISDSPIREIIVTNTVAVCSDEVQNSPKVVHMDVSQLISEAIRRQHYGEWGSFQLEIEL